jgi:cell division septation protein DedD
MDINYKQDQFELFPGATPGSSGPQPEPRLLFSSITLSGENIIVLTVSIFLAIIVSFSFGVEKGKRFTMNMAPTATQTAVAKPQTIQKPIVVQRPQMIVAPTQPMPVKAGQNIILAKKNIQVPASKITVASTTVPGGFYTVQVASFKKQEFAEDEAHGLKTRGYETFIITKGKHLILCAGRFGDQGAANILSGKLKSKYKDCLVRRL